MICSINSNTFIKCDQTDFYMDILPFSVFSVVNFLNWKYCLQLFRVLCRLPTKIIMAFTFVFLYICFGEVVCASHRYLKSLNNHPKLSTCHGCLLRLHYLSVQVIPSLECWQSSFVFGWCFHCHLFCCHFLFYRFFDCLVSLYQALPFLSPVGTFARTNLPKRPHFLWRDYLRCCCTICTS